MRQSAGMFEPVSSKMTSPTTKFQMLIVEADPDFPLMTGTFSSFINA